MDQNSFSTHVDHIPLHLIINDYLGDNGHSGQHCVIDPVSVKVTMKHFQLWWGCFIDLQTNQHEWLLDIHLHVHLTSLVHERYNPVASIPEILTVYLYLALWEEITAFLVSYLDSLVSYHPSFELTDSHAWCHYIFLNINF